VKFCIGDFYEDLSINSKIAKLGEKYGLLYVKIEVGFIASGDIESA
jgi:hypothetical protein